MAQKCAKELGKAQGEQRGCNLHEEHGPRDPKITPDMTDKQEFSGRRRVVDSDHPKGKKDEYRIVQANVERVQERIIIVQRSALRSNTVSTSVDN